MTSVCLIRRFISCRRNSAILCYYHSRRFVFQVSWHSKRPSRCAMGLISEWEFLVAVAVIVVLVDLAAIAVCIKSRHDRRKSTTVVMVSLLASDALFGAVLLPVRVIELCNRKNAVFPYIYAYLLFLSAFNALYLSFDRYASIMKPLWRRLIGTRTICRGLVITWTIPAVISIMPLSWVYVIGYNSQVTKVYTYILLGLLCLILISIVILQLLVVLGLLRYWSSSKKKMPLRKNQGRRDHPVKELKRKINSSIFFFSLIATSIVTWLPTIIYNISPFPELSTVSLFTLMGNALIDPLLVISFNTRSLFKKWQLRKRGRQLTQTTRSRVPDAAGKNLDGGAKIIRLDEMAARDQAN